MEKESIYVFGVSEFSKVFFEAIGFLFNVEGFIDNNVSKQGEVFCGKPISGVDVLKKRKVKVMIVSSHYEAIIQQLKSINCDNYEYIMDFDCLVRKYPTEMKEYISMLTNKVRCNIKEDKVNTLIINLSKKSPLSESLIRAMNTYSDKVNAIGYFPAMFVPSFPPLRAEMFNSLGYFDCVDIHYLAYAYSDWIEQIRANCENLVIRIFGSDVYVEEFDYRKEKVLDLADAIVFSNRDTMGFFLKKNGNKYYDKFRVSDFGLEVIDYIDEIKEYRDELKKQFGIRSDKIVVMCGTNATRPMNHLSMIDKLSNLPLTVKDKLFLFVPVMYPKSPELSAYTNEIKKRLETVGIDFHVTSNEPISFREIAKHRIITDILIFVRDTDQLSSSMLESLYAGAVVLAGAWLPYEDLIEKGLPIFTISSLDDIEEGLLKLLELIDDKTLISEYAKHSKNVLEFECRWKYCYKRWEDIYLSK